MEKYEIEVLVRMFDRNIIGHNYKPLEAARSRINWDEICRAYNIRMSFSRVARHLVRKGYVSDHGKSLSVVSLTAIGVAFVRGILIQKREESDSRRIV